MATLKTTGRLGLPLNFHFYVAHPALASLGMLFEWDELKRRANLAKHYIDFLDPERVFSAPVFEKSDNRHGEERVVAIGMVDGLEIVVVYAVRGKRRRIISARRAHRDERDEYANHLRSAKEGN